MEPIWWAVSVVVLVVSLLSGFGFWVIYISRQEFLGNSTAFKNRASTTNYRTNNIKSKKKRK